MWDVMMSIAKTTTLQREKDQLQVGSAAETVETVDPLTDPPTRQLPSTRIQRMLGKRPH
jgi:hypothetical protein